MMSFKATLFLFITGLIGISLAVYGDLPDRWVLVSATVGIGAWIIAMLWGFIDRTLRMIHHLKQSKTIDKEYKAEKSAYAKQVIQRASTDPKKRAASKRLKLWLNTILGIRY